MGHVRVDAVFAVLDPGREIEEPRRGAADAPIFCGEGLSDRLAPDECRQVRRRRCRPRGRGIDQGGAARLRHGRRSRHLGRCLHRAVEAAGQIHQRAGRGRRYPARPFRTQGARQSAVGRATDRCKRTPDDRRLGGLDAGRAERDRPQREMAGAAGAGTARGQGPGEAWGQARGARMRPASRCWSCTAPMAISCTNSCRSAPTSGPTSTAVPNQTGCASSSRSPRRSARIGRDHKPLFVRLSVEDNAGWGPEQSARLARILKTRGVDVIDCSSGGITDQAPILGKEIKYNYQVPAVGICPPPCRYHDHGGRPDHPRRPG